MLFPKKASKKLIFLGAILLLSALFYLTKTELLNAAWEGPLSTEEPPAGNVARPLNRRTNFVGDNGFILSSGTFDEVNNTLNLNVLACDDGEVLVASTTGKWECGSGLANTLLEVLENNADASAFGPNRGVEIGSLESANNINTWLNLGGALTAKWVHAVATSGVSSFAHQLEVTGNSFLYRKASTTNNKWVGITQNQVGGVASMEFTTTDVIGNQATRLMLRGNIDNPVIDFYTGARGSETSTMTILGTGNVGIGNVDPQMLLEVGSKDYDAPAYIRLHSNADNNSGISFSEAGVPQWWIWRERREKNSLTFGYGDVPATRVMTMTMTQDTGDVGIGTTTPNARLHVFDTSRNAEINIQSVLGAGNHWAIYNSSTPDNSLVFWRGNNVLELKGSTTESGTKVDVKGSLCLGGECKDSWPAGGVYIGKTATTSPSVGGYGAADNICSTNIETGSHVCSQEEMFNSMRAGLLPAGGSVFSNAGASGRVGENVVVNDCNGWTTSTSAYAMSYWSLNGKNSKNFFMDCNISLPFACCK
jgi:hypothetical protein